MREKSSASISIRPIEEIFIVSVTMDNINAVPQYLADVTDKINAEKKNVGITERFYNLNIDEYEMLMRMLETDNNIFALLQEYDSLTEIVPFANFLHQKNSGQISMTSFMSEIYQGATGKMKALYGIE